MLAHEERVVVEQNELNDKISKLSEFIKSDFFSTLDTENKNLLTEQLEIMQKYSDVLIKRINLF